jgi:hypothetical protein
METVLAAVVQPEPPGSASNRASPGKGRRPELAPLSIYHEPWWLDIATDGNWREAAVVENGATIGRMPYAHRRLLGSNLSRMPRLVRTLGPAVLDMPGKPVASLRRRLEIIDKLIDQLPAFDSFEQFFDPRIQDAVNFIQRGFAVGATYAFRVECDRTEEQTWSAMNDKTRNVIRKSGQSLRVETIDDPELFLRFYEANLGDKQNYYGTECLSRLLDAIVSRKAGRLLGAYDETGQITAATAIPWDSTAAYHFLSTRQSNAIAGATSLLIWEGLRIACGRGIAFDLDGVVSRPSFLFLSGFGGHLVQRLRVRRETRPFRLLKQAALLTGYTI